LWQTHDIQTYIHNLNIQTCLRMSIAEKGIDEALAVATAALAMSAATTSHGRASESGHTYTYIHTKIMKMERLLKLELTSTYIHTYIRGSVARKMDSWVSVSHLWKRRRHLQPLARPCSSWACLVGSAFCYGETVSVWSCWSSTAPNWHAAAISKVK